MIRHLQVPDIHLSNKSNFDKKLLGVLLFDFHLFISLAVKQSLVVGAK